MNNEGCHQHYLIMDSEVGGASSLKDVGDYQRVWKMPPSWIMGRGPAPFLNFMTAQ